MGSLGSSVRYRLGHSHENVMNGSAITFLSSAAAHRLIVPTHSSPMNGMRSAQTRVQAPDLSTIQY